MSQAMRQKKVVLALSGGMDSTALLGWLMETGYSVDTVSFYYGSKHNKFENEAALEVANHYKNNPNFINWKAVDLSAAFESFKSNLFLNQGDIPEGHYEAANMKATVVPCRNLIFASWLAGYAESNEYDGIVLGVHSGDHAIYPDCRPDFIVSLGNTINQATDDRVDVLAPFLNWNKTKIIKWGHKHYVPFPLTRTCYKNQSIACGKCGSCQERLEAFAANKLDDIIKYESRTILEK